MSSVPLTQAVTSGDADAVSAVLANGAEVNERTGGGQTPLILATIFGYTHLIPLLLDAGADPQLRDNLGLNAIDWAQRRGATEALEFLTNKTKRHSRVKIDVQPQASPAREAPATVAEVDKPKTISPEEKSQRWLAGLKQRIAEQSQREPQIEQIPVKVVPPEATPAETVPAEVAPSKIEAEVPRRSSARKRCPKCNAIYNSELVAYCAHHFVPLVDADEPPIISEPQTASPALFWMIIVITLSGSLVVGSIIAAYFYNSNNVPPPQTAASPPAPIAVQKGFPTVDPELEGKAASLPIAECPLNGQEAIPGTVVVRVVVDKDGRVKSARASGGDWLLRDAATAAATKSTFSPQKLRGRETEGTITYTFDH